MKGGDPRPVLHEPECQLGIHLQSQSRLALGLQPVLQIREASRSSSLLADECKRELPESDVCEHFASIEALKLDWPGCWGGCTFPRLNEAAPYPEGSVGRLRDRFAGSEAAHTLSRYVPVFGQPWGNLKSLVIRADGVITCCIPRGLPHLEEIVLLARSTAMVYFEDPTTILSALKTLHIFGQPLVTNMDSNNMPQVADSLARKGLLMSTVSVNGSSGDKVTLTSVAHACICGASQSRSCPSSSSMRR